MSNICSFDSVGNLFAFVASDNRLKIWNPISGNLEKEFTDPKHLTVKYSCISWPNVKTNTSKKSNTSHLLALGTEKGTIVLWNMKKGEVSHIFDEKKDGHSSKVNDLAFSSTGMLFSCAEDGFFCQWDIQSGELLWKSKKRSESVKRLAIDSNCSVLATASSSIKMWDLSSKKVLKKFTGHSAPISSISFTADDKYLVTSSNDRFLYIWNCSSESESTAAIQVLTCDSVPLSIEVNPATNQDTYYCTALSDSNTLNLWSFTPTKKSKKPLSAQGTISSKSPILSFTYCNQTQLHIAYGNTVKPTFQKLDFISNREIIKEQQLNSVASNVLLKQQDITERDNIKKKQDSTVIGNVNMPIPDVVLEQQEAQPGEARLQLSIQEKLESLGLAAPQKNTGIPKSDSVQTVLLQALHTKDSSLLETCLEVADPTVIKNTVQNLPTAFVVPFLTFAVERFRVSPNRTEIIPWLRNVLIYHSAYLMSVPDVVASLTTLYSTIDSRVSAFPLLLKLSGRLDLLLSQISYSNTPTHYIAASTVYEESSDDDDRDEESEEEDVAKAGEDLMDYEEDE